MFNTNVPKRMERLIPDARLIAVLREPASRAYSHYRHMVARGREERSFGQAIDQNFEKLEKRGCIVGTDNYAKEYHTYIERGIYEPQIRQFKDIYGDRLFVLCSEEFFQNPLEVLEKTKVFIGCRDYEFKRRQYSGRTVEQPCANTIKKLKDFYKPYNETLYQSLSVRPMWG